MDTNERRAQEVEQDAVAALVSYAAVQAVAPLLTPTEG